ncbi:hypothetical protein BASA81_006621 [Batrachochytrium salamandrivorans]|nr:hypothetical protein BASA81_006621 [Batrachochytrium salamandrivorans]
MGNFLSPNLNPEFFRSSPLSAKEIDELSFPPQYRVGVSSMQGWRRNMEDAYSISNSPDRLCLGVFDGHGTSLVSQFASEHWESTLDQTQSMDWNRMFHELDEQLVLGNIVGGSTALCAVLKGLELTVAHCGDSRALLLRGEEIIELTQDHKPTADRERARIEAAGGTVSPDGRVNGKLSCSRSLGDFRFKANSALAPENQVVSCQPEVGKFTLVQGDLVLLACDGVYEAMTNKQVADCVNAARKKKSHKLCVVASKLLDRSLAKGSRDNMTCILQRVLTRFRTPTSPRAKRRATLLTDVAMSPSKRLRKTVSFSGRVKEHDGVRMRQNRFETLVGSFLDAPDSRVTERDMLQFCDWEAAALGELAADLEDLITRLEERRDMFCLGVVDEDVAPVLPKGGGKSFRVFACEHLVCLRALSAVVQAASHRASTVCLVEHDLLVFPQMVKCTPFMRRRSSREGGLRKVSFCGQAKRHDGLLPRQARFEQLITSFFQSQTDFTEFAVFDLVESEAGAGLELAEDLSELVFRMQCHQHDKAAVALLPGGGGLGPYPASDYAVVVTTTAE